MTQDANPDDPFELLKRMWAPMGLPLPGAMAPLLDPAEIGKRIADLKSVENWLAMNLNVLRMTIQGLEMQRATLAAFQAMQNPAAAAASAPNTQAPPSAAAAVTPDAWWNLLQQMQTPAPPTPQSEPKREKKPK